MESLWLSHQNIEKVRYRVVSNLRYRVGTIREAVGGEKFEVVAIAKVEGGVRFSRHFTDSEPDSDAVLDRCLAGSLCARPYVLGQSRDDCSYVCALGLVYNYCSATGMPLNEIAARTVPGQDWTYERWHWLRWEASWQGVRFPERWRPEDIPRLLLTLNEHSAHGLFDSLLRAIGSRRRK